MDSIEFHNIAEIKGKSPAVIIGFPGTGLVGSVAASQMVEALELSFVGYISSPNFAPLAAIHDFVPMPPARIHYSHKLNVVVILSEMTIPVNSSMELADKLFNFAKSLNASSIISLGGISLKEEENAVYMVSSDKKMMSNVITKKIAKPIREGATTGVIGILLAKGALEKYPVHSILAEASQDYLDPGAAANALRVLSKLLGISISIGNLEKEGKELNKALKETVIKSKMAPKKNVPSEPTPGGMYG